MAPLTVDKLVALLNTLESDRTERKRAWAGDASDKVRQAVCAFANDLSGHELPGVVFIGASDDGSPNTIEVDDQLLLTLADMKSDGKIVPPPTMTVERRVLKGSPMAVITVWPADAPPVRYDGRVWIRTGPQRDRASAQDERVLNEKRRARDSHFESHPVAGATLADLNRIVFDNEYLHSAFARDVLQANERSLEQRLAASGMVAAADEPVPTVLGLPMLVMNRPSVRVTGLLLFGPGICDAAHLEVRCTATEALAQARQGHFRGRRPGAVSATAGGALNFYAQLTH